MVDFPINSNIFKIGDQIVTPVAKGLDEQWFAEDITVLTSNSIRGTTIVVDFSFTVPSIVEYTLDGGTTYVAFNSGDELFGGQSRYLRVTTGVTVNFRAKTAGTLNRCIVGEV